MHSYSKFNNTKMKKCVNCAICNSKITRVAYINIYDKKRRILLISFLESYILFNICSQGLFNFIIQLYSRNITNITKIINIITIKSVP